MRTAVSVPIVLVCYILFVILFLVLCNWFFDRPAEWPYVIPIIVSSFSLGGACVVAEEKLSSKSGAKITAMIVAAFWILFVIVDITGNINDVITVLAGKNPSPDTLDIIMFYVDVLLNAKIFAVVSCLLAAGQSK